MNKMVDLDRPDLAVGVAQDESGRVTGLKFSKRERTWGDYLSEEERQLRRDREQSLPAQTLPTPIPLPRPRHRPKVQAGEMPPGWFGRRDKK